MAVLQSGQLNLLGKPYLEESACHFSNRLVKPCAEHYFDSINRMSVIESSWIDPTRISDGADGDQPWPSDKVPVPTAKTLFAPNWKWDGGVAGGQLGAMENCETPQIRTKEPIISASARWLVDSSRTAPQ